MRTDQYSRHNARFALHVAICISRTLIVAVSATAADKVQVGYLQHVVRQPHVLPEWTLALSRGRYWALRAPLQALSVVSLDA